MIMIDRDHIRGHVTRHPLSNPKKMREFLSQTRFWVDSSLTKIRIKEMDSDYLLATMIWLIKRAAETKFTYEMYYLVKGANADKLDELAALSSEQFIRQTPLFQKMWMRYIHLMKDDDLVIPSATESFSGDDDGETYQG